MDLKRPLRLDDHSQNGSEKATRLRATLEFFKWVIVDLFAWFALITILNYLPDSEFWQSVGVLVMLMVLWRVAYLASRSKAQQGDAELGNNGAAKATPQLPYTCAVIENDGKTMYLVATLHISPRACEDVESVINRVCPDMAMIELDEERLENLSNKRKVPINPSEDLQPITISGVFTSYLWPSALFGSDKEVLAQRAAWNAEQSGETIAGGVVYESSNPYGAQKYPAESLRDKIVLMQRGGPEGHNVPFATKAHNANSGGAKAVLVVNTDAQVPAYRLGAGPLLFELRIALSTCNCGFPPVPVLLLSHDEGKQIQQVCESDNASSVHASFKVLPDHYPRRTLRRRLCQGCALLFSGIGVLYGIIECFAVEVGGEFLAAVKTAAAKNIPCVCIDVDLDRFWGRLGTALIPTPWNIINVMLSWLAFPRLLIRVLFPARGSVDVLGCLVLHVLSFPIRTWVAFAIAGFGASTLTSTLLKYIGSLTEDAGEKMGAFRHEDRDLIQSYIMLGLELLALPQLYEAVAASRDEVMYRSIVTKSREQSAKSFVVVVGAAHSNGILQRVRSRGL